MSGVCGYAGLSRSSRSLLLTRMALSSLPSDSLSWRSASLLHCRPPFHCALSTSNIGSVSHPAETGLLIPYKSRNRTSRLWPIPQESERNFVLLCGFISDSEDRGPHDRRGAHKLWWKGLWRNRKRYRRNSLEKQTEPSTRPGESRWFYRLSKVDGKS